MAIAAFLSLDLGVSPPRWPGPRLRLASCLARALPSLRAGLNTTHCGSVCAQWHLTGPQCRLSRGLEGTRLMCCSCARGLERLDFPAIGLPGFCGAQAVPKQVTSFPGTSFVREQRLIN